MGEEWNLFEDATASAHRRRGELVARLRERVIAAGDKLSEEQVNAIVARMADTALEGERLRHGYIERRRA
ncbi:MAG TPA: hypothetical protein VM033_07225 [Gemmatimonadaceae bacterium]|nr:hypothetical protein [Gemmatimonadaceae bacterium]